MPIDHHLCFENLMNFAGKPAKTKTLLVTIWYLIWIHRIEESFDEVFYFMCMPTYNIQARKNYF